MHFDRCDSQVIFWFCSSIFQYTPNIPVYFYLIKNLGKSKMFSVTIMFFLSFQPFFHQNKVNGHFF